MSVRVEVTPRAAAIRRAGATSRSGTRRFTDCPRLITPAERPPETRLENLDVIPGQEAVEPEGEDQPDGRHRGDEGCEQGSRPVRRTHEKAALTL